MKGREGELAPRVGTEDQDSLADFMAHPLE